jgi:D-alanine transaminase
MEQATPSRSAALTIVYLNGEYLPLAKARVPVEDRGFLFSDGIYEVVRLYGAKPFRLEAHVQRFVHSAEGTRLPLLHAAEDLPGIIERLQVENDLSDGEVYIQYTRGLAHPRTHAFPPEVRPTLLVMPLEMHPPPASAYEQGMPAITVPDLRWQRCDIKSTMLVPNLLAKQQAREKGAWEAILVRDGRVTEGSSTNMFAVINGQVVTHPTGCHILGGISRDTALGLAEELGLIVRQEAFTVEQVLNAQEVFLTSTTQEVLPLTRIDDHPIGNGRPGPVTLRLGEAFRRHVLAGS